MSGGPQLRRSLTLGPLILYGLGVIVGAGAKILGPIQVGDRAKIGSNAVVVHDVPVLATAVGIPARVIAADGASPDKGFAAYALTRDLDDPVVQALSELEARTMLQEARLAELAELFAARGEPPPKSAGAGR